MQTSDSPSLIPVPFANSGAKNTIPTTAPSTPGLASLEAGFPPITMTPVAAGGIPPSGMDFNGILNLLSAASRWSQAGGFYPFSAEFAGFIGGYPRGSIVRNASGGGYWQCTVDNNTSDPDTGGAGWIPVISNAASTTAAGIISVATPAQAAALTQNDVALTPGNLPSALAVAKGSIAFVANGSFTVPPSITAVYLTGSGGGGGGGAYNGSTGGASGGGGGASCLKVRVAVTPGAVIAVTVGAGGGGAQSTSGTGVAGGATSFGSLLTLGGGSGGVTVSNGGVGGVAVGATGQVAMPGQRGEQYNPLSLSTAQGGSGGSSLFGRGGYGGGQGSGNQAGQTGGGFGAGGGGGASAGGGSGISGFLIVEW